MLSKSEVLVGVAETLAQLSTRLNYWSEFDLAYRVRNLSEEITLMAGGLRVEEVGGLKLSVEEVEEGELGTT